MASSSKEQDPRARGQVAADRPAIRSVSSTATPMPALGLTAGNALSPSSVLALQRSAGNHAVQRALAPPSAVPRGSIQRTPPLVTMDMFKAKGSKKFAQRPTEYGPVTIEFEDVAHVKYTKIVRPVRVSGLVYPSGTGDRPGAPEPSSGVHVSEAKRGLPKVGSHGEEARNQGITDAQKGHIMALELGGPDIRENIVPQWAQWQSNGEWRQMERDVLAIAQGVEKKKNRLHYSAQLHYKAYEDIRYAPKKSVGMPAGFTVTITEVDPKTRKAIDSKSQRIIFAEEQKQNRTDDMMFMRTLQELAGKSGETFDYHADWNPQAKKEKAKKGKQAQWKGGWRDDTSLNPFAEREREVRKEQVISDAAWADYKEGWRDGYDYVEEDYDSDAYLRGYAAGREAYVDDYDYGFVDGYSKGTKPLGETEGYYHGFADGIVHRQKGGKKPEGPAMMEASTPDTDYEMSEEDDEDQ